MYRPRTIARWAFAVFLLPLLLAAGCGSESADNAVKAEQQKPERSPEEIKADFDETVAKVNAVKDNKEELAKLWLDYLERNPDTSHTFGPLRWLAMEYYGDHLNDPEAAIALVNKQLNTLTGNRVEQAQLLLVRLYGMAGDVGKLRTIASEMDAEGALNFVSHKAIADAAVSAEAWDLATEHAGAAIDGTTPKSIRTYAESLGRELSEDDVATWIGFYKRPALLTFAEAHTGKGDVDAALKSLEVAEELNSYNYVGVSNNAGEINSVWARTLIAKGEYEAAMRRIAPDAIYLEKERAIEIFKEAYVKSGGDETGLEDAMNKMRAEIARPIPEFEAYDYNGNKVAWSELKGRVTLLNFWHPT